MIPLLLFLVGAATIYVALVETAFAGVMRLSLRLIAERSGRRARLDRYLDDPLLIFVPARLLRGILTIAALTLMSLYMGGGWRGAGLLFVTGLAFWLVCGHLIPALIVSRDPERVLALLLPSFAAIASLVSPLATMFGGLIRSSRQDQAEEAENAASINGDGTNGEAATAGEERKLLRSVVDFGDTLVREVMTPRPDIAAITSDQTVRDLKRLVSQQQYSRVPVYRENLDNIVGLVVVKDMLQREEWPALDQPVSDFMRPAMFVPDTKRVAGLLKEFQQRRDQLAIVVDEYGGTAGLVTIEDLLEELVGEIRDEYDNEAEPIVREADGALAFSAKVAIGELAEPFGVEIEADGFETVGGWVLARVGRVPAVGETFEFDGLGVEVLEAERRRIHRVRVRRLPPAEAGEGD
ncbi:MAG: hemolysin family protein [Acidobacteriota bacterium]|nr:hemolysin family protein [Acidobacteriota bacterium]